MASFIYAPEYLISKGMTFVAGLAGLSEAQTRSTRLSMIGTRTEPFAVSFVESEFASAANGGELDLWCVI